MSGVVLGTEAAAVKTTDTIPAFMEPAVWWGREIAAKSLSCVDQREVLVSIYCVVGIALSAARELFHLILQQSYKVGMMTSTLQKRKLGLRKFEELVK